MKRESTTSSAADDAGPLLKKRKSTIQGEREVWGVEKPSQETRKLRCLTTRRMSIPDPIRRHTTLRRKGLDDVRCTKAKNLDEKKEGFLESSKKKRKAQPENGKQGFFCRREKGDHGRRE